MIFNTNQNEVKKASGKNVHIASAMESPALVNVYGETTQDGTPTPDAPKSIDSSVISEIVVQRANLLNLSTVSMWSCTYSNGVYTSLALKNYGMMTIGLNTPFQVKANTTYYIKAKIRRVSGDANINWIIFTDKSSTKITVPSLTSEYQEYIFSPISTESFESTKLSIQVGASSVENVIEIKDVMVCLDTDDTYEPYTEPTVYTLPEPITLNGINGVSDYIDFKRGVLVQKFKKIRLTSDINWIVTADKWIFTNSITDFKHHSAYNDTYYFANTISNISVFSGVDFIGGAQGFSLWYATSYDDCRFTFRNEYATSVETWKNYLDSNEVYVMYELAEPVETPLSSLPSIITYAGINNISNNANAPMSVAYASTVGAGMTLENTVALNGLKLVPMSESDYNSLTEKDSNTLYLVY